MAERIGRIGVELLDDGREAVNRRKIADFIGAGGNENVVTAPVLPWKFGTFKKRDRMSTLGEPVGKVANGNVGTTSGGERIFVEPNVHSLYFPRVATM